MKKITFIIALFFLFSSVLSFAAGLSNRKASDYTKRLYKYLSDIYGKQVITGQMENAWNDSCNMLDRVYKDTAKYPALMGFDFMNYTGMGYKATNVQTDRAIWFCRKFPISMELFRSCGTGGILLQKQVRQVVLVPVRQVSEFLMIQLQTCGRQSQKNIRQL